jgi:hypothetical protein
MNLSQMFRLQETLTIEAGGGACDTPPGRQGPCKEDGSSDGDGGGDNKPPERVSSTYGVMPSKEKFEEHFDKTLASDGNGRSTYNISLGRSDSRALDGFRLGDGEYTSDQLYKAVSEVHHAWSNATDDDDTEKLDAAMDVVSGIMETLNFEWI